MLKEAIEIRNYCESEYCSDKEAQVISELFKSKYQRSWLEVIDENSEKVE